MNDNVKEYRQKVAEMFIQSLNEKKKDWTKPWAWSNPYQINATTNQYYRGINQFYLSMICAQRNYTDFRWATFKQAQEKGWKIKRGAKGVKIEYWFPYDQKKKQSITWQSYKDYTDDERKNVIIRPVYNYVFNAQDIIGIPELQKDSSKVSVEPLKLIERLSANMRVTIAYDGLNSAYYKPSTDSIHLPEIHNFVSQASYASTALHELSHSTGAFHRLNRTFGTTHYSQEYAYEELVAEVTASYMSKNLDIPYIEDEMENHKAYIQSWIEGIEKKPEMLIMALKEANFACDYLEFKAELINRSEYLNRIVDVTVKNADMLTQDIKKQNFPVTEQMKSAIKKLTESAPGIQSLKDLHKAYKDHLSAFTEDAKHNITSMANMLKSLEITKIAAFMQEQ